MTFDDPSFLALVLGSAGLYYVLALSFWRRCVLLGASFAFLTFFGDRASGGLRALEPVVLFTCLCMIAVLVAARWRGTSLFGLALLILLFAVLKGYAGASPFGGTALTVGLSYILFRTLQVLADVADDSISAADIDPVDLLLFLISFLTLSAGPIQRYEHFLSQLRTAEGGRLADINPARVFPRALAGYVKLLVVAPYLIDAHGLLISTSLPGTVRIGFGAALFMVWIYVNFSGYMDIVIAAGRLFGFELPENFNRPDRASGFLDLWNRWHITLSRTFLTYVFNPLVRFILILQLAGPIGAGLIAYMVVFFLIGIWHGPGLKFALSGLLFSVCAVVNKLWQVMGQRQGWTMRPSSFRSFISGGLGLGACAISIVPTWPMFTSASDVVASFGPPERWAGVLVLATTAGCFVKGLGLAFDAVSARVNGIDWPRLSPLAVGLTTAALVFISLTKTVDIPAVAYYQRF